MKRKIQLSKGYCINKKSIAKLLESHMAQLKGGIKEKKKSCQVQSCGHL